MYGIMKDLLGVGLRGRLPILYQFKRQDRTIRRQTVGCPRHILLYRSDPRQQDKLHNTSNHPPPANDSGRTARTPLYPPVQTAPLTPSPLFSCPGQSNRRRPVPVPVTGVRYNSLLWMCTLNTLTWPDLNVSNRAWELFLVDYFGYEAPVRSPDVTSQLPYWRICRIRRCWLPSPHWHGLDSFRPVVMSPFLFFRPTNLTNLSWRGVVLGLGVEIRGVGELGGGSKKISCLLACTTLARTSDPQGWEGRKQMIYLTTHSTHFIYGYMASDIW